ncbi:MAG: CBS domain-containing protein [Candidatus Thermoplasmatota archaeon]|nr:CBS domain-containing protein [Candidatus Thermoplasmatota archaeon]
MTTKVITLTADDFISTAIAKMSDNKVHHIPIVDEKGGYIGMLDYNLLFKRESIPVTTKIKTIMERTPSIASDASIAEAARLMVDSGLKALPVLEKNKIKGIVTSTDIVHSVNSIPEVANLTASEIMSGEPITVTENDDLVEALRKMRSIDETSIPVVDKDGKISGLVNINDISKELWRERGKMRQGEYYRNKVRSTVKDVMVSPLVINGDQNMSTCMEEMIDSDARVCTVVDENMIPEGVISQSDILAEIVKGSPGKTVLVNLSGAKFEDPEVYDKLYSIIEKSAKSIAKLKRMRPMLISIHIEEYNQTGKEVKYSIRGKMVTESKTFFSRSWDWNVFRAIKELMGQFEKMVEKNKTYR